MRNICVLGGCPGPLVLLVLALVVWLPAADLRAQWPTDGLPVYAAGGPVSDLQVVSDDQRGLYLVWIDERSGVSEIYAQHVDADGNIIWDENGVPVIDYGIAEKLNHICTDGAGGLWITWQDWSYSIHVNHLDADGDQVFYWNYYGQTEYPVSPVCAPDGQGGVILAWLDTGVVFAVQFGPGGSWVSPTVLVGLNAYPSNKLSIAANTDADGGVLLAWERLDQHANSGYVQWVDATMTPRWNGTQGINILFTSGHIDIADRRAAGGGAHVIFTEPSVAQYLILTVASLAPPPFGIELYLDFIPVEGFSLAGAKVIDNGEQGVLCIWGVRNESGGQLTGIYARSYDYDHSLVWGPITLPGTANQHINGWDASLKADTGDLYVSWQVDVAGTGRHQYSIVDRATGAVAEEQLVPGAYSETAPRLVSSGLLCPFVDVHPLAAWIDNRNPDDGIYANSLSAEWTAVADDAPPIALRLHANAPNPFNPQTTIRYDLPAPARVNLKIHDLAGRVVRVLRNEALEREGRHAVVWDGRDDAGRAVPSGVYIYRLQAGEQRAVGRMALVR